MSLPKKLSGLIIDDDLEFIQITQFSFQKEGINLQATQNYLDFFEMYKNFSPDFCIIDLYFGGLATGFSIVETLRKKWPGPVPLFIVSATKENKAVAHALEMGATDFIFKPLNLSLFLSKLQKHLPNPELEKYNIHCFPLLGHEPDRAYLSLKFSLSAVDETGLTLQGPHKLAKGTVLELDSPIIGKLVEKGPLKIRVITTWMGKNDSDFLAYGEFVNLAKDQEVKIKSWLTRQKAGRDL